MFRLLAKIGLPSVLLAWTATTMTAAPARFLRPMAGERLEPGESIEVSWALDQHQARAFDEMELILSLDGGRTFPLRLTRDLSPGSGRVTWRVPALPAGKARLALRGGSDEEPDLESIAAVSDAFEIVPRAGLDLEQLFQFRGEWRTRESATSPSSPVADALCGDAADQMRSAPSRELAAEPPAPAMAVGPTDPEPQRLRPDPPAFEFKTTVLRSPLLYVPLRQ
jgi:hypothetical protein